MAEAHVEAVTYLCSIVATVPTGLEKGAAEECKEVLGRKDVVAERGSISFPLQCVEELSKVDKLRSIENYSVLVKKLPDFCSDEDSFLERLLQLPFDVSLDWATPLSVWRHYYEVVRKNPRLDTHVLPKVTEKSPINEKTVPRLDVGKTLIDVEHQVLTTSVQPAADDSGLPKCSKQLTFRVTCVRGGRKHPFSSMEAAGKLGAGLARLFGWKVQMKNSDIEVLLKVSGDSVTISFALSRESKSNRNITHFGPTTLRSAIAYGLLRHACIQPGEIVVDPMCGGGSISIEGSLAWLDTYHLSGDNHELATPRAMANVNELRGRVERKGLKVDVLRWDITNLPLRTASVDVVVTDLPFGKKSGRRVDNWELYPSALEELGRVCRPSYSRAVLLTHDNKALSRALLRTNYWRRHLTKWINIGGLTAAVYLLHRTDNIHA